MTCILVIYCWVTSDPHKAALTSEPPGKSPKVAASNNSKHLVNIVLVVQEFQSGLAGPGWFWIRVSHGCCKYDDWKSNHLKDGLKLEDLIPRWLIQSLASWSWLLAGSSNSSPSVILYEVVGVFSWHSGWLPSRKRIPKNTRWEPYVFHYLHYLPSEVTCYHLHSTLLVISGQPYLTGEARITGGPCRGWLPQCAN